jgi:hypothetical protein
MLTASGGGIGQIALVDLTKVFSTPTVTSTWVAVGAWAWEDATNLLVASTSLGGALIRFHVGAATADAVTRPSVTPTSKVVPLPRLG